MCLVLFLGEKLRLQRTDLELEVYHGLFNLFFFVVLVKYGKCQVNFPGSTSKPVHSGNMSPFYLPCKHMGVEVLHGVENFHQVEVLFLQVAYNCLHVAKMYFMKLLLEQFLDICTKDSKKCQLRRILNRIYKHQ